MGDMADLLMDSVDWGSEWWDEGPICWEFIPRIPDTNKRCKFCGASGFHWVETESGWRLATVTGRIHSCKAYKRSFLKVH